MDPTAFRLAGVSTTFVKVLGGVAAANLLHSLHIRGCIGLGCTVGAGQSRQDFSVCRPKNLTVERDGHLLAKVVAPFQYLEFLFGVRVAVGVSFDENRHRLLGGAGQIVLCGLAELLDAV